MLGIDDAISEGQIPLDTETTDHQCGRGEVISLALRAMQHITVGMTPPLRLRCYALLPMRMSMAAMGMLANKLKPAIRNLARVCTFIDSGGT